MKPEATPSRLRLRAGCGFGRSLGRSFGGLGMSVVGDLLGDLVGLKNERSHYRINSELVGIGCQRKILEIGSWVAHFVKSHCGRSLILGGIERDSFGNCAWRQATTVGILHCRRNRINNVIA